LDIAFFLRWSVLGLCWRTGLLPAFFGYPQLVELCVPGRSMGFVDRIGFTSVGLSVSN
jgi:hypothetical protein